MGAAPIHSKKKMKSLSNKKLSGLIFGKNSIKSTTFPGDTIHTRNREKLLPTPNPD